MCVGGVCGEGEDRRGAPGRRAGFPPAPCPASAPLPQIKQQIEDGVSEALLSARRPDNGRAAVPGAAGAGAGAGDDLFLDEGEDAASVLDELEAALAQGEGAGP